MISLDLVSQLGNSLQCVVTFPASLVNQPFPIAYPTFQLRSLLVGSSYDLSIIMLPLRLPLRDLLPQSVEFGLEI